jgi:hypothetical protein
MRTVLWDGTPVSMHWETRTDLEGCYRFPGLLVGSSCEVAVFRMYDRTDAAAAFEVLEANEVALPDLVLAKEGPAGRAESADRLANPE